MTRFLIISTVILLSLLVISSCDDNPVTNNTKFSIDQFPTQVGSVWTYHRYDSLNSIQDTVTVTIADTTTLFDTLFTSVWLYHFSRTDTTDIKYVNIRNNYLTFFRKYPDFVTVDFRIEFPLEVGKYWLGGQLVEDSCFVEEIERVQVYNNQLFQNAYHTERIIWRPNDYGYYHYWFVPNTGMVKMMRKKLFWEPNDNDIWELISFNAAN